MASSPAACGLDFGTSNTTLGVAADRDAGSGARLLALDEGRPTVPSAVFYSRTGALSIGREAMRLYVEGAEGRLMRSLKAVLGSPLINERTQLGRRAIGFGDVIADFVRAVKARAETALDAPLGPVVLGRPVFFVDDDEKANAEAEASLRALARQAGFPEVSCQFEPIAAAFDYEQQVSREEIALIADIGGGTSDFSIVRIGPDRHRLADRGSDVLANDGVRIGGTDFDRHLSLGTLMPLLGFRSPMKKPGRDVPSGYFHDLATWSSINRLYDGRTLRQLREVRREAAQPELVDRLIRVVEEQRGHSLAIAAEDTKIALASSGAAGEGPGEGGATTVDLAWLEPGLARRVQQGELVAHTERLAQRIAARIGSCLAQAGIGAERIDALFLTGGSTRLPHVRSAIAQAVPGARLVDGDSFGSVGTGLALEAGRRYGPAPARRKIA